MASIKRLLTVVLALALFAAGILFWWPFAVLSVIVGALVAPIGGVALGLLLDLLWGTPQGTLHYLYFPWTLLAVVLASLRYFVPRFFFSRGSDTL